MREALRISPYKPEKADAREADAKKAEAREAEAREAEAREAKAREADATMRVWNCIQCARTLALHPKGHVLKCEGHVSGMFWTCLGYVLDMLGTCFGHVRDMFWIRCGQSLGPDWVTMRSYFKAMVSIFFAKVLLN